MQPCDELGQTAEGAGVLQPLAAAVTNASYFPGLQQDATPFGASHRMMQQEDPALSAAMCPQQFLAVSPPRPGYLLGPFQQLHGQQHPWHLPPPPQHQQQQQQQQHPQGSPALGCATYMVPAVSSYMPVATVWGASHQAQMWATTGPMMVQPTAALVCPVPVFHTVPVSQPLLAAGSPVQSASASASGRRGVPAPHPHNPAAGGSSGTSSKPGGQGASSNADGSMLPQPPSRLRIQSSQGSTRRIVGPATLCADADTALLATGSSSPLCAPSSSTASTTGRDCAPVRQAALPPPPDPQQNQSWGWLMEGILHQVMQGLAGNSSSLKQFRLTCRHWKAVADCNLRRLHPSGLKPRDLVLLFPRLQQLELVRCRAVRNRDLYVLAHSPLQLEGLTLGDDSNKPWVTNRGLASIGHMGNLQRLLLHDCNSITNNGLSALSGLTSLRALSLRGCCKITNTGLEVIAGLTALTSLNLHGCSRVNDAGVGLLVVLPLKALNLGMTRVRDEGVSHLVKLTGLTELAFDKEELTDGGVGELAALTALRTLALREVCNIETDTMQGLLSSLKHLQHLDFHGTCDLTDARLAACLPHLPQLQSLDLRETWVMPRGLQPLSALPNLLRLAISVAAQPPGSEGYAVLSGLTQLTALTCTGEELSRQLLGALVQLPALRELDVSSHESGMDLTLVAAPQCMVLGLAALTQLHAMDVSRRPLHDEQLRQLLGSCRWLRDLWVHGAPVTVEQVRELEKDFSSVNIWFKPAAPLEDAEELLNLMGGLCTCAAAPVQA